VVRVPQFENHCSRICHNQNMLYKYNIVSLQSSPDIQNCIITSSVLILLFTFNFTTFIWPNITCSIFALQCGICYIIRVEEIQPVFPHGFSPTASPYKHTSVQYSTVSVTCCQRTIIKFYPLPHWYLVFSMSLLSSLSIPNLSKN